MPTLQAVWSASEPLKLLTILVLAVIVCFIRDWKTAAAAALLLGIIAARHAFLSDCVFALPALFLVWPNERSRIIMLAATSPVGALCCFFAQSGYTVLIFVLAMLLLALTSRPANPLPHAISSTLAPQ